MPSKPVQSRNYPTSFLWLSSSAAPARPVLCRKFPRTPTHVVSANARSSLAAYVTLEISSKSHSLGGTEISSSALADVGHKDLHHSDAGDYLRSLFLITLVLTSKINTSSI
ncbi:hypothetical protein C8J57DRAFT_1527395 [Mycena rebaudengoi]|nr:hypothetical protein C8J57DRAFT_1527395 [Mycena rebaudengoi]